MIRIGIKRSIVTLPLRGVIHYICISCENEIDEDRSVIGECVLIYLGRWRGVIHKYCISCENEFDETSFSVMGIQI